MKFHKMLIETCLYPLMEAKKGNQVRQKTARLQEYAQLPLETLQKRQNAALAKYLRHCIREVPAYRAFSFTDAQLEDDPMGCLRQLPPLQKSKFQEAPEQYLAEDCDASRRIANRTGGSTGKPIAFFMDRQQVEWYEAARWRGLSWFGITPGSAHVMVWGSPIELEQAAREKYLRKEWLLKNRTILSAYELSEQKVPEILRLLRQKQPEYLYGYAGALAELARLLESHSEALPKLKAVIPTSETLYPEQRRRIEKVFRCPVGNEYGARDAGILAYSCPKGHLHITMENAVIEVLDPMTLQPLPAGQVGVLAITDINNTVQPRPRYLLGDAAAISPKPCECGCALPILQSLEGREDAFLLRRDGTLIHGHAVGQLLMDYDNLRQFQFIQHTPETGTLRLVPADDTLMPEELTDRIRGLLPGVEIRTELVDEIPVTKSGKVRYAIREFPLQ